MLHRTRHLFIRQQTAVINAIRAHLAEFGIVAPVKCLAEAEEKGISYTELKQAAGGNLAAFIAAEIRRP